MASVASVANGVACSSSIPLRYDDDEGWVRNMQRQVRANVQTQRDWESLEADEKELVRNFVAAQAIPADAFTGCPVRPNLADN